MVINYNFHFFPEKIFPGKVPKRYFVTIMLDVEQLFTISEVILFIKQS
jgi:hypothetical protein